MKPAEDKRQNMMLSVVIFSLLLVWVNTLENTEFCPKIVIKDCAACSSEVLRALDQANVSQQQRFEKCTELQVNVIKASKGI